MCYLSKGWSTMKWMMTRRKAGAIIAYLQVIGNNKVIYIVIEGRKLYIYCYLQRVIKLFTPFIDDPQLKHWRLCADKETHI